MRCPTGFAPPHVAGIAEDEPDEPGEAVNDSLGSVHPADTIDADPDEDPEAGGGIRIGLFGQVLLDAFAVVDFSGDLRILGGRGSHVLMYPAHYAWVIERIFARNY